MGSPQREDSILDGRLITERRIVKAEIRERLRKREGERERQKGVLGGKGGFGGRLFFFHLQYQPGTCLSALFIC